MPAPFPIGRGHVDVEQTKQAVRLILHTSGLPTRGPAELLSYGCLLGEKEIIEGPWVDPRNIAQGVQNGRRIIMLPSIVKGSVEQINEAPVGSMEYQDQLLTRPPTAEPLAPSKLAIMIAMLERCHICHVDDAFFRIVVPCPHRINCFVQLSATAFVNTARINPSPIHASTLREFAKSNDFLLTSPLRDRY